MEEEAVKHCGNEQGLFTGFHSFCVTEQRAMRPFQNKLPLESSTCLLSVEQILVKE